MFHVFLLNKTKCFVLFRFDCFVSRNTFIVPVGTMKLMFSATRRPQTVMKRGYSYSVLEPRLQQRSSRTSYDTGGVQHHLLHRVIRHATTVFPAHDACLFVKNLLIKTSFFLFSFLQTTCVVRLHRVSTVLVPRSASTRFGHAKHSSLVLCPLQFTNFYGSSPIFASYLAPNRSSSFTTFELVLTRQKASLRFAKPSLKLSNRLLSIR